MKWINMGETFPADWKKKHLRHSQTQIKFETENWEYTANRLWNSNDANAFMPLSQIEWLDETYGDDDKFATALIAFSALTKILVEPYMIKQTFKSFSAKKEKCTVVVCNRSFTEYGNDAKYKSVKNASLYLIRTFAALEQFRHTLEECEKEQIENYLFCKPSFFQLPTKSQNNEISNV